MVCNTLLNRKNSSFIMWLLAWSSLSKGELAIGKMPAAECPGPVRSSRGPGWAAGGVRGIRAIRT